MPSEQPKITRRQAVCCLLGAAATAAYKLSTLSDSESHGAPAQLFVDLHFKFSTADAVVEAFAAANTPFLMASYAVFFPDFLRRASLRGDRISLVREAADKQRITAPHNLHRLDAIPAVTAAHSLVDAHGDERLMCGLCEEISTALDDPRREVKEIVLQNLICAVAPTSDAMKFFAFDGQVLNSLHRIVLIAEDDPNLLSPASLAIEFLLRAEAVTGPRFLGSLADSACVDPLGIVMGSKAAHFWHLKELVCAYREEFSADAFDATSLPPQSSEALMAWRQYERRAPKYMRQLSLLRARLLHQCLAISEGAKLGDDAMTMAQAKAALPKLLAFFRHFELAHLVQHESVPSNKKSNEEMAFRRFLKERFPVLLEEPEIVGIKTEELALSQEDLNLRHFVPFSQHRTLEVVNRLIQNRIVSPPVSRDNREQLQDIWPPVLETMLTWGGAASLFSTMMRFADMFLGRMEPQRANADPPPDPDKFARVLTEKIEAMRDGAFSGTDEQEEHLGDIPVPATDE